MTTRVKWGVTVAICVLLVGMFLYPRIRDKVKATKETQTQLVPSGTPLSRQRLSVDAEVLDYRPLTDKTIVTGSTMPDEEVNLAFESSGKITNIFFNEGSHVKKGELLAKINDQPLQAELKKLEAQIPLAKERVYRQQTLLAKDAVSHEAYEQVVTEYDKLMADIDLIKARIAQTELRAPFDGIIGLRNVSEGAYASPTTVVSTLTCIAPLKIEFSVPERYATDIREGTPVIFRLNTAGDLMEDYPATVYAVESKIDESTRSLKVRAKYPNRNEAILPGRYTSVEITRREIKKALAIPSQALIPEMGRNIVYLYKNGVAEPVEIILGLRTEDRVQALEGLQAGDTLITSGVMQLRTGIPIHIDNLN